MNDRNEIKPEQEPELPAASESAKNPPRKLGPVLQFLRELAVVVAGIAITFSISGWITRHNENKALSDYLFAVKKELEDNRVVIGENQRFYHQLGLLSDYLRTREVLDHHPDSVRKYSIYDDSLSVINSFFTLAIKTTAFESLKSSGVLYRMKDKELLNDLTDNYKDMERLRKDHDDYMTRKNDLIIRLMTQQKIETYADILDPRLEEMYYFFLIHYAFDRRFKQCGQDIDHTLSRLHL